MPQAIIAAAQAVGAWYASLGPIAQAAVQVAASAATSVAVNAIMQGNRPSPQGGMNQTNLSSDAPRRLQIGSRNNGGVIVDIQTGGNKNSRGFMVFYLGEGPMGNLKRIWSGGNRVYNGTITHGTTTQLTEFDSPDARVYVTYYDGRPGQTYHTNWQFTGQTPASKWPSTRVGTGCAYVVVEVRWDPDTLPTLPSFSFEVEGAKMYDRRLDTTAGGSGSQRLTDPSTWTVSTNPAVALDHFMLGRYLTASDKKPVFGIGLDPSDVPYDKFEALADLCDESVSLNGGGTQTRYEVNGFIESDEPFREVILKLTKAMNARPADFGGKVSVVDGEASASVLTITDGMMIEGVPEVYTPKRPRNELPGSVIGTYQDLSNNYYPVEYPEIRDSSWETTNGSVLSSHRYDLEHETSSERAQRLATLYAQRQYRQATLSGTYSLAALELEDGDWFTRDSTKFSGGKVFEVIGSPAIDYDNLTVSLFAREVDATDSAWDNSGVVTPADPDVDDDELPVISLTVPTISVSVVSYTGNSTTWSFLEATNDNYDTDPNNIELEIRLDAGGATPTGETRRAYIPYGEETVDISGLIPGAGYVIRARAYLENKFSDWTSWSSFTSGADFVSSGVIGQGALATQERASRRKYTNTFTGESGTGFGGANGISSTYVDCAQLTLDVVAGESVELEGAVDFDYLSFENPTNADRITIYGKLLRGTDVISEGFNVGIFNISGADALSFVPGLSFNQIDFPPSTGNVTYKLQLRSDADPKSPNNRSFTFKSGVGNYFKATTYESGANETVLQNTYTAHLVHTLGRVTCSSAATMPYSGVIGQFSNTLGAATLSSAATVSSTDVTPDSINWTDSSGQFVTESSDETFSGINTTISVYAQRVTSSGSGSWQYRINQGTWTTVTNGSGGAFSISNGDDLQFRLTNGGTPYVESFQIKNLSDSSAVLDTCTLELLEFEL
jgi:hypothetical protein